MFGVITHRLVGTRVLGFEMSDHLAKTPLTDWHASHHGKLVDFAGWSMPIHYGSITDEHVATRQRVSLFDVSHMGRINFVGPDSLKLLDRVLTRNVSLVRPHHIRYSLITNETGGVLDDVLVYHWVDMAGASQYSLVVNASNREKIVAWIGQHLGNDDVQLEDQTTNTAMIAVQGPKAIEPVGRLGLSEDVSSWKYYTGRVVSFEGTSLFASRTGYTGEDGIELSIPADAGLAIWERLMEVGQEFGIMAAGLGARDTLRLEAAMPLYGHELEEDINPVQAGLDFAVSFDHEFVGRDSLVEIQANRDSQLVRVGLETDGKRVPRQHCPVLGKNGNAIGEVTSGTFSPTLEKSIAMGYVSAEFAAVGTELLVDIRGRHEAVRIVKLPFYVRG